MKKEFSITIKGSGLKENILQSLENIILEIASISNEELQNGDLTWEDETLTADSNEGYS